MKEAWNKTRVWMTTCVGSVWLGSTGLLEGKKVTTNRAFLGAAREMYPETEWVDRRWVVDGKEWHGGEGGGELWTSGAAGAGVDMIAAYTLKEFDPEFVRVVALEALEFMPGGRGEEYENGGYLEGLESRAAV
jgi:transcriptional regulator GlxA family with amidase domain